MVKCAVRSAIWPPRRSTHAAISGEFPAKRAVTWLRDAKALWTSSSFVPERDDAPVVDDGDAIAEPLRLFHVVGGVNDRGSTGTERFDHLKDAIARLRIDANRRLIHQHHARPMNDASRHIEPALHTAGKILRQLARSILQRSPVETPSNRLRQACRPTGRDSGQTTSGFPCR